MVGGEIKISGAIYDETFLFLPPSLPSNYNRLFADSRMSITTPNQHSMIFHCIGTWQAKWSFSEVFTFWQKLDLAISTKRSINQSIKIWWNHYCNLFQIWSLRWISWNLSVSNSPEFCKCCSEGVVVTTYLVGIHHILPVLIKAEDGDRYQLALRTIYHSLPLRPLPLTYFAHSAMKCKFIWSIPFVSIVPTS